MSRLDAFIRRLAAQRECLNHAAALVRDVPGPVLELGLGNGRTYDHLRTLLPDREIFVFDRRLAAHPDCMPDSDHAILGDLPDSLFAARARLGDLAALAHSDIGTGDPAASRQLAARVAPALDLLMAPGAVVVSDQPMTASRWTPLALPEGTPAERYFIYRVGVPA